MQIVSEMHSRVLKLSTDISPDKIACGSTPELDMKAKIALKGFKSAYTFYASVQTAENKDLFKELKEKLKSSHNLSKEKAKVVALGKEIKKATAQTEGKTLGTCLAKAGDKELKEVVTCENDLFNHRNFTKSVR